MKLRLRTFRRQSGVWYLEDTQTNRQESLRTSDEKTAKAILAERSKALLLPESITVQAALNVLRAAKPELLTRTWQNVFDGIIETKSGPTQVRWMTAKKDRAFDALRHKPLFETVPEDFDSALKRGTVSTNVYLRRAHNLALRRRWIYEPVLLPDDWPAVEHKSKRGITEEEYRLIIARERNSEWRAYYHFIRETGGSQTDVANLCAENVNWHPVDEFGRARTPEIAYIRCKLRRKNPPPSRVELGPTLLALLKELPQEGPLFPYLRTLRQCDRALAFAKRLKTVGLNGRGLTLHCFRYSWAERAKINQVPERVAQESLGHKSNAYARSYSKGATLTVPSLEVLEAERKQKLVRVSFTPEPPQGLVKNIAVNE
jgi:hypothetical protein